MYSDVKGTPCTYLCTLAHPDIESNIIDWAAQRKSRTARQDVKLAFPLQSAREHPGTQSPSSFETFFEHQPFPYTFCNLSKTFLDFPVASLFVSPLPQPLGFYTDLFVWFFSTVYGNDPQGCATRMTTAAHRASESVLLLVLFSWDSRITPAVCTRPDPWSFFERVEWIFGWRQKRKKNKNPRKLTWNLKMNPWKRRFLLTIIIFRFHVSFRGGNRINRSENWASPDMRDNEKIMSISFQWT